MRFKELVKTKTFWAGVGLIGYGITLIATGAFEEGIEEGIKAVLEGLAVIFLRDAISRSAIGGVKDERDKL